MQEQKYSIKLWAKDDRPREKLLSQGTNSLKQFGAGSYSQGFLQAVLMLQSLTNKIEGSQA